METLDLFGDVPHALLGRQRINFTFRKAGPD